MYARKYSGTMMGRVPLSGEVGHPPWVRAVFGGVGAGCPGRRLQKLFMRI
jgi:hypothetical protein